MIQGNSVGSSFLSLCGVQACAVDCMCVLAILVDWERLMTGVVVIMKQRTVSISSKSRMLS